MCIHNLLILDPPAQATPIKLDGLQISMSRETAKDPPQTFIKTFSGGDAKQSSERQVTNFPHPYPQVSSSQALMKKHLVFVRVQG